MVPAAPSSETHVVLTLIYIKEVAFDFDFKTLVFIDKGVAREKLSERDRAGAGR
jgi:hypothetical protein